MRNHRNFVLRTSRVFDILKSHATALLIEPSAFLISTPTKFPHANPRTRMNHHLPIYCDRPDLLCASPHDKHCVWPRSHRNLCHEGVLLLDGWSIPVFAQSETGRSARRSLRIACASLGPQTAGSFLRAARR